MNKPAFWRLIKLFDWSHEGDDEKVLAPIIKALSEMSDEEIFSFNNIMAQLLYDIDSKKIAMQLYGSDLGQYFSHDMFLYQRCVAVANGQGYYSSILYGGRQLVADLEYESLLYIPQKAWAKKHNKDECLYPHIADPCYESCSNRELWRDNCTIEMYEKDQGKLPIVIQLIYDEKKMDEFAFFSMMKMLDWSQAEDDNAVLKPLIQYLSSWPDEITFAFDDKMNELLNELDIPAIRESLYGSSDDYPKEDFLIKRCTALFYGRAYYKAVLSGEKKLKKREFGYILYAPKLAWAEKHKEDVSKYPHNRTSGTTIKNYVGRII